MNVGELVEALEDVAYGEPLPVLVAGPDGWETPIEVRHDDDRVILIMEPRE